ncbi:hypothetical protein R1sor_021937 [Riccia sorocarpa]|uniref:60S ribosomal protein L18a-like protein n=1 Tax=Riccia sorocarpa TaxID=122646 RepID=A0ABD3GJX6_9MARC
MTADPNQAVPNTPWPQPGHFPGVNHNPPYHGTFQGQQGQQGQQAYEQRVPFQQSHYGPHPGSQYGSGPGAPTQPVPSQVPPTQPSPYAAMPGSYSGRGQVVPPQPRPQPGSSTQVVNVNMAPPPPGPRRPQIVQEPPLPFGIGFGWFLFILGWFFLIPWYIGLFMFCGVHDAREKPGLLACTIGASLFLKLVFNLYLSFFPQDSEDQVTYGVTGFCYNLGEAVGCCWEESEEPPLLIMQLGLSISSKVSNNTVTLRRFCRKLSYN